MLSLVCILVGLFGLAIDDRDVFWFDPVDGIQRMPREGGVVRDLPMFAPGDRVGGNHLSGVAMSGGHLYWGRGASYTSRKVGRAGGRDVWSRTRSGAGGLMRLDKEGGEPTNLLPGAKDVRGVAVDATHVYWLDGERREVGRMPL